MRASLRRPVFHRDDARSAGLTDNQIRHRLRAGIWVDVLPRVYRHAAADLDDDAMRRAALMWAGDEAALSHRSAAVAWRLDGVDEGAPEIVIPKRRNLRSQAVVVLRSDLGAEEITTYQGLRTTTLSRTLLDIAGVLHAEALESAIESARRRHGTSLHSIRRQLGEFSAGHSGAATLRSILDNLDGVAACESLLEVKVARLLRSTSLPEAVRQHWVSTFGFRYRLDFAWPQAQVALECDGRAFHEFERDRTRGRHLSASGWRILPVTWREVTQRWSRVQRDLECALP